MEETNKKISDDQIRYALREAVYKRLKRYPGIKLKDRRIQAISKEAVLEVEREHQLKKQKEEI